ncbi:MAG TPA: glycine cleavage system protein GcvH [bacterium (Candidatus Stahlbacteria)]|nr:glycine cleavage system protein GcvH [Candidatus Stahlbacteria bacterium]
MEIQKELKYAKTHEWIRIEGETATIGITDYAQSELSDIVAVELPKVGKVAKKDKSIATIEAVKAVSDVYSPVSGEVIEVNEKLVNSPELINKEPYGEGWILKIKVKDPKELDTLLTADDYERLIKESK